MLRQGTCGSYSALYTVEDFCGHTRRDGTFETYTTQSGHGPLQPCVKCTMPAPSTCVCLHISLAYLATQLTNANISSVSTQYGTALLVGPHLSKDQLLYLMHHHITA